MSKNRLPIVLLVIADLCSLVYLLGIGYFNNLLVDDYLFAAHVEKGGIIGFVVDMYNTWQGRFGSFLMSSVFLKLSTHLSNLLLITIIQLLLGYTCFYLFIRLFFKKHKPWLLWLISVFVINISLMSLFEISTFYWLCASTYILLIFLTFLLVWFIFNPNIKNYFAYTSILVLSILIGGGAETYTPLVIMVLGIIGIFRFLKQGYRNFFSGEINIRLSITVILLGVFFIIMLIAPGNKVRMNYVVTELHFIHPTGFAMILKTFRAMINLLFLLASKGIYYIIVFPVFFWLGSKVEKTPLDVSIFGKKNMIGKISLSILILFAFLWISLLPGVYAINDLMPQRSLCYVSFTMILFFAYWGVVFGMNFPMKRNMETVLVSVFILVIGMSAYFSIVDIQKCKKYNTDISIREKHLLYLQSDGFKGIALVKPIYIGGTLSGYSKLWNLVVGNYKTEKKISQIYFPYEQFSLSTNAKEWRNQGFKDYLKLDFDVVCDSTNIHKN